MIAQNHAEQDWSVMILGTLEEKLRKKKSGEYKGRLEFAWSLTTSSAICEIALAPRCGWRGGRG